MNEAKKKRRSFAIIVMMIIMAVALCMTMISCGGGNETDSGKSESQAKTEQSVDAADEKTTEKETQGDGKSSVKDKEKENSGTKYSNNSKNSTKESQKSTTAATTQAKQVCYITIENYCSGKEIALQGGDTVYSILCRSGAAVSGSGTYVKGINGKFEFDEGPTSGWMYYVNGSKPSVSCGSYSVKAGDSIKWDYVTSY